MRLRQRKINYFLVAKKAFWMGLVWRLSNASCWLAKSVELAAITESAVHVRTCSISLNSFYIEKFVKYGFLRHFYHTFHINGDCNWRVVPVSSKVRNDTGELCQ